MKKFKILFASIVLTGFLASCSLSVPYAITKNAVGSKVGESSSIVFGSGAEGLGIFLNGNYGIAEAAKNGGITGGVSTVDLRVDNYILFTKVTLIVTGE